MEPNYGVRSNRGVPSAVSASVHPPLDLSHDFFAAALVVSHALPFPRATRRWLVGPPGLLIPDQRYADALEERAPSLVERWHQWLWTPEVDDPNAFRSDPLQEGCERIARLTELVMNSVAITEAR